MHNHAPLNVSDIVHPYKEKIFSKIFRDFSDTDGSVICEAQKAKHRKTKCRIKGQTVTALRAETGKGKCK